MFHVGIGYDPDTVALDDDPDTKEFPAIVEELSVLVAEQIDALGA